MHTSVYIIQCLSHLPCYFMHSAEHRVRLLNTCTGLSGKKEKLLVAVGVDVRSVSHDGSRLKCVVDKITKNVVAVAIHYRNNVMFWADAFLGKIFSSSLNSSHIKAKVVASGKFLRDLAIDWITGKLYWLTTSTQGDI